MARIKFEQGDGSEERLEASSESTVMSVAVRDGIAGINGECGGCLDRATCHVYVDESQSPVLPAPSDDEIELLSVVSAQQGPNSRLGCPLKIPSSINELVIYVPERQS
jgi:2Fe-2S ferredoxin